MKTAILFSGTAYNYRHSIRSLMENLVIPNDADVFILTSRYNRLRRCPAGPAVTPHDEEAWREKVRGQERHVQNLTERDEKELRKVFGERLKILAYVEDMPQHLQQIQGRREKMMQTINNFRSESLALGLPQPFAGDVPQPNDGNIRCVVDQYGHAKRCFQLMEEHERANGFRYDYVMRARLDFVAPFEFNLSHYYLGQDFPYLYVCGSHRRDEFEFSDEFCWFSRRDIAEKLFLNLDRMGFVTNRKYTTAFNGNEYIFCPETQFSLLLHELEIPTLNVRIYRTCKYTNGGDGWDYLNYAFSRGKIDLDYEYQLVCKGPSDINEHLPTLRELASRCESVTELGVRYGNSTVAFMHAQRHFKVGDVSTHIPMRFTSYDVTHNPKIEYLKLIASENGVNWDFRLWSPTEIESTDFLFIDTNHHAEQCTEELRLHADKVKRYIAFHDTTTFWEKGQGYERGGGLRYAIEPFLRDHKEWRQCHRSEKNNGLLILERRPI